MSKNIDWTLQVKEKTPRQFAAETCTCLYSFTEHHGANSPHSINAALHQLPENESRGSKIVTVNGSKT